MNFLLQTLVLIFFSALVLAAAYHQRGYWAVGTEVVLPVILLVVLMKTEKKERKEERKEEKNEQQ